jgi:antiviral helicase SKI2
MERLSLTAKNVSPAAFEARLADEQNGTVENVRPRKQAHQTSEELLAELENEFLTPSDKFNTKWLNTLQRCVSLLSLSSGLRTSCVRRC